MSTYFERAKQKASNDRHWKQAETGLMTAGAALAVFLVKTAVEHVVTKNPPNTKRDRDKGIDRLLRGF